MCIDIDKLKKIYYDLDDKIDIFTEIKDENIGENYICYSISGEYGYDIKICDNNGNGVYKLFVSNMALDNTDTIYITTFFNEISKKGLYEKIYSNRTEHYIDDVYHSTNFNDDIMEIVKANTKMIMCDKKYSKLYEFITNILEKDDITLIPKSEFI